MAIPLQALEDVRHGLDEDAAPLIDLAGVVEGILLGRIVRPQKVGRKKKQKDDTTSNAI